MAGTAGTAETAAVQRAVAELRRCVGDLRTRYGDLPPVRRLANDADRLEIDLTEVQALPDPPPRAGDDAAPEIVEVPGEAYDETLWTDGDEEGLGGFHAGR